MIKYIMIEINGKDVKLSPEKAEKLYHELDKIYSNTGYPLPIKPTKIDPYPYTTSGDEYWKNWKLSNIPITYT